MRRLSVLFVSVVSAWVLAGCLPALEESVVEDTSDAVVVRGNEAHTLYVAAEYTEDTFRLHYRLEVDNPSWYHQYWLYQDGEWTRMGSGAAGPDAHGLYEDRISMMLDDGSVEGFSRYGGWMLVHPGMRSLDSAVGAEQVRNHPILGLEMGRSDVRKYIPQSRTVERYTDRAPWDAVKPTDALEQMRDDGEFLDLWQWRAHRSHPVGYADNGYVLHYRLNSEGRGMFRDNADDDGHGPAYMYDASQVGKHSLRWGALLNKEYTQNDPYFLSEATAVPFDPNHDWQDGDVIPFRLLQVPDGARGAISASGGYANGQWRITLERSLASPNARDSKTLEPGGTYHVAFAVHHGAVGARHHHVSLPHELTLATDSESAHNGIVAVPRPDGFAESDAALTWHEVGLIYPGQVDWEWLTSRHPGGVLIRADLDIGVDDHHNYLPLFQRYIERHERRYQTEREHRKSRER
ncbi:MAG: hypothetical protein JJU10_00320 [Idiomarina sp.]|nr:hypothetical protein [Idiomarina sp.]